MLILKIAFRYLFSKKSTNAINIISIVSIVGLTLGTAALIIVLSVFNGFETVLSRLVSNFNPEIKVTPSKGKVFVLDSNILYKIQHIEGIQGVSCSLEEVALFEYEKKQDFGIIKGVDDHYNAVNTIDSSIVEGKFGIESKGIYLASSGLGVMNKLSIDIKNVFTPIVVYSPNKSKDPTAVPFNKGAIYPSSTFNIQSDFDNEYVITSLDFVQGLLNTDDKLSAMEIKLKPNANIIAVKSKLNEIIGKQFVIRDRIEQNQAFLKIMNMEKWMSYVIFLLVLILVVFNLVGSLWMIVLEKQKDIAILKAMGMDNQSVKKVILSIGMLISSISIVVGFGIGILFYFLQKKYGIIPIPEGFIISSYPIELQIFDFIIIAFTVIIIGYFASLIPARRAERISSMFRE
jgi:lipoprotein-releasing system permease protein